MKLLPKLIPDWQLAWRFASVQAAVLLALLSGLQAEVLPLISPLFPADAWPWVSGSLALLVVVLRLVAQSSLAIEREHLARENTQAEEEALRRRWESSDMPGDTQAPLEEDRRPADLSPLTGVALLLAMGLVMALLATTAWVLLGGRL
jgi:small-conductance mechanosensitive channel